MKIKGADEPHEHESTRQSSSQQIEPPPTEQPPPFPRDLQEELELLGNKKGSDGMSKASHHLLTQALRSMMNPELPHPHTKRPQTMKIPEQGGGFKEHFTQGKEHLGPKEEPAHPAPSKIKNELQKIKPHLPPQSEGAIEEFSSHREKEKGPERSPSGQKRETTTGSLEAMAQAQADRGGNLQVSGAGLEELGSGSIEAATGSEMGSHIDKIIATFQENQFYTASLSSVQVSVLDQNQAKVTVGLTNGIEIELELASGGKELNITIRGLTPEQQALLDNPQEHANLRNSLAQKGFAVHQIITERGEQLQPQIKTETSESLANLMQQRDQELERRQEKQREREPEHEAPEEDEEE